MTVAHTHFSAEVYDGDYDYHYVVRPGADSPDSLIEIVYVEMGEEKQVTVMQHHSALAIAAAITRLVELNRSDD